MGSPGVLTEKLRRPEAAGLARARLERPLADLGGRLGLVVAPPGSGKTTLLARVAAATTVPVAWYRVTADDSDEASLVAHLRRALQDSIGLAPRDPQGDAEDGMSGLLDSLERWAGRDAAAGGAGLVILDDLHEIAGTAAERAVERFVLLRPHRIGVLIGSRRHPGMNIPRLQVSGALVEVSSDDLRFRSWEVEELFIGVFHEHLSPESAAALTRRTGGWAAGLQLFHLATTGRSAADRDRAVADLGGRSKLVRSYLARNVLSELPEDRRQFLLRTCTLGSMTGPLCDSLLETSGSAAILDELEQRQLFTSSEDDGATFRYHEVLRSHLEWALIAEYGPDGARGWYARSAALLEQIGDRRGAVRAYARAEDWGSVARMIQAGSSGPGGSDAEADVLLPAAIVAQDPWLSLAQARRRVREGSLPAAVAAFRQAEALLDEPEFQDSCRAERAVAQLWSGPASGPGAGTFGVPAQPGPSRAGMTPGQWSAPTAPAPHWSARLRAALHRTGSVDGVADSDRPGTDLAPEDRLVLALCALLAADIRSARVHLDRVEAGEPIGPVLRLLAQTTGTIVDLLDGGQDPSGPLSRIALDAEVAGLPWIARLARGFEDAVLVGLGGPGWRLRACTDRVAECARSGDDWGAALLTFAAAVAGEVAHRRPATAAADGDGQMLAGAAGVAPSFADAAGRFRRLDAPVLAVWCDALDACLRPDRPDAAALAERTASIARMVQLPAAEAVARTAVTLARGRAAGALAELAPVDVPALTALVAGAPTARQLDHGVTGDAGDAAADDEPAATVMAGSSPPRRRPGAAIRVRCFGGLAIEIDDVPVDLGPLRPRARSLLRLLAMNAGRDVHREVLVDALWPGVEVSVGTRRLQVAVSSGRHLLDGSGLAGADMIERHGDAYRLTLPAGGSSDVLDFEIAVRDAARAGATGDAAGATLAREAALAAYGGDLLPEEGPAEHVAPERDRYRLTAADVAAQLATDHHSAGRLPAALAAARRSVHLDRYQDTAWRTLVEIQEAAGDLTAAERTRREHARAQAELDIVAR